jgi:Holliday junction DNA helicase RuvA
MFCFITGRVDCISDDSVVIDHDGVGYKIKISNTTHNKIVDATRKSDEIKIYTHVFLRDDNFVAYGFLCHDELELFDKLISVSGIGPRAAMNIISVLSCSEFCIAVLNEDVNLLSKVPGIGRKTAQRLILDLKGKLDNIYLECDNKSDASNYDNLEFSDAIEALIALGYLKSNVVRVVSQICKDNKNILAQDIIKKALVLLGKK